MSDPVRPDPNETDVYAVFGVEPEVQAYAMAKYSRSALSLRESLTELNAQKAESFLNTFYFQYGHRSIADLAHIAFAVEKLSLLAAIELEDEQRWDGQERSTRYQDFSRKSYFRAKFDREELAAIYTKAIEFAFDEYGAMSREMFDYLAGGTPKPAEMKQDQYERTLRARAFDIARYLLPLATNTSLGQIVNARTLETQVSRLLSSEHAEVRTLGEKLKSAAKNPAWDVNTRAREALLESVSDPELAARLRAELLKPVLPAPTLVKYAEASPYLTQTREELRAAAAELMNGAPIEPAPRVDLLDDEPVEIELATTLLYEQSHYSYRQIRRAVEALPASRRKEITDLGTRHRGRHDEVLRAYCSGQRFRFDILMDLGGFRDMHRHRRCTQIHQGYTFAHGYDTPSEITAAGQEARYIRAMEAAAACAGELDATPEAAYLLPLAYRKRTLFKMDFAEAVYITEIRSTPAGHFSYRRVAWEMFRAVAERHPDLAGHFRVRDINEPIDLLQR